MKTINIAKNKGGRPKKKAADKGFTDYSRYWHVSYTEIRSGGERLNFKSIIVARSISNVKTFLCKKIKEDNPSSGVSNIKAFAYDRTSTIRRKKISILNWFDIRNCAFPNELNILFKYNDRN